MEEVYFSLINLEKKVIGLQQELHRKERQLQGLELENQQLRQEVEKLQSTLQEQKYGQMASLLLDKQAGGYSLRNTQSTVQSVELKLQLSMLIQDLTHCINYLSKNE